MSDQPLGRFGFPKLVVRDLDRQAAFYRAALGYGEGQFITGTIAGRPIREIIFFGGAGNVDLLILSYDDDKGPLPEPSGVINGFFTADLDAFEARVIAAGGTVAQPIGPIELPSGTSRIAFYADPEGYLLEVIEG